MTGDSEPGGPLFDDGPLDGTRLARDIAETVPGVNAALRKAEWRADLKRRVRERLEAKRQAENSP